MLSQRRALGLVLCLAAGSMLGADCRPAGRAYGWGENDQGQLGRGYYGFGSSVPAPVGTTHDIVQVSASHVYGHGLAVTADHRVFAWGRNDHGQVGPTNTVGVPHIIEWISQIKAVEAGGLHSMALGESGQVFTWGDNRGGQVGNGSTSYAVYYPYAVPLPAPAIAVNGGQYNSLALLQDGTVYEWGNKVDGTMSLVPVQVPGLSDVKAIAGGTYHNLALKNDGSVWAWGSNYDGALGDPSVSGSVSVPIRVSGLPTATKISAGFADSYAVAGGRIYAWGANQLGQHGGGEMDVPHETPYRVPGITGVVDVSSTGNHVVALVSGGNVYAWGYNYYGELGNGAELPDNNWPPPASYLRPGRVPIPFAVSSISAGTGFSFASGKAADVPAIKDGDVVVWVHGYDADGCSGIDLQNQFGDAVAHFRDQGWTGQHYVVSYYDCDTPWTDAGLEVSTLDLNDGEPDTCAHDEYHASGHSDGAGCSDVQTHTRQTSIRHLAYHLAWELYNRFTVNGKRVRIMAHSMGGLITRHALLKVEEQDLDFPPRLNVASVHTYGTPHDGGVLADACGLLPCPTQAEQMDQGNEFLNELGDYVPTGPMIGGPRWWLYGAQDDDSVSVESALHPLGASTVEYESGQAIEHSDYFRRTTEDPSYECQVNRGAWQTDCKGPMYFASSETLQE